MTIPLLLVSALAATSPSPVTVERTVFLMGTTARIVTVAADREGAVAAGEAAFGALRAAEERLSTWTDTSELAALNHGPVGEILPLSDRLSRDLVRVEACVEETEGAFDPAVGTLVRAWDLRGEGRIPGSREIEAARRDAGWEHLELLPDGLVRRRPVLIEEGGFGKGAALDRALSAAVETGASGVEIDLGGQIARLGMAPEDRPVVVAHPRRRGLPLVELTVDEGTFSVATSGNGERSLLVDGRRLGHLLDPRTGRPARDFGSLTVVAPSALRADCLSTGLFVLGPERALSRAEKLPEIEAIAVSVSGDRVTMETTSGLRGEIRPLAKSMFVEDGGDVAPELYKRDEERFTWTVERSPSRVAPSTGVSAPAEKR